MSPYYKKEQIIELLLIEMKGMRVLRKLIERT